jgi:hypothetical protein
MDLTSYLAIGNPPHAPDEAFAVLSRQYPGLKQCEDGRFHYRGYWFDFVATKQRQKQREQEPVRLTLLGRLGALFGRTHTL